MAYADIGDVTAGDPVTEAYLDQIRANFIASAPDAFTTKGDLFIATAADAGARVAIGVEGAALTPRSIAATGAIWQPHPVCAIYNDANIDPAEDGWVSLTFNAERADTSAMHSLVANTGRITIAEAGYYMVYGNVLFDASATASNLYYGLRILKNGAQVVAQNARTAYRTSSFDASIAISALLLFDAAHYIELQVYVSQDINVLYSADFSPEFSALFLR